MNDLESRKLANLVVLLKSLAKSNAIAKSVWDAVRNTEDPRKKWVLINHAFVHAYQFVEVMNAAAERAVDLEGGQKRLEELMGKNFKEPVIGTLHNE